LKVFSETCYHEMLNDFASHRQYDLLKDLYSKQPKLVENLLEELKRDNSEYVVDYIATIYNFFDVKYIEQTHEELIS
jgi:hypothetical protein